MYAPGAVVSIAPSRPVLRYHGGKWRIAPWVIAHFPPHRVYVEPFGGGASVLLRKARSYAEVYNDLDQEVVNVFRVLRDPVAAAELRRLLELTPYSRVEFWQAYEQSEDQIERARRRIIRSFLAFGTTGGKRNRSGFRAAPWRAGSNGTAVNDWVNYPDAIERFTQRLRGVLIECRPAVEVIRQQDTPETLFYVDPPYPLGTRSSVRCPSHNERAYAHDLTDDDHRALADVLRGCAGAVVLSGYPCPLYDEELYPDWTRVERVALADGARRRTEVLWLNPRAAAGVQGHLFDGDHT